MKKCCTQSEERAEKLMASYPTINGVINPTMAGGGLPILSGFYSKQISSCVHILANLGLSVYEKYFFQIGPTILAQLALKLGKERMLIGGGGNNPPPPPKTKN